MGREQELRDAARDGNIAKLENLLSAKKSSIMSSLRKGLNINCQDENGNTALHLAALNGRSEAAILLLQNDASANIPENLGNYPLHLAAFNGHHEVADVLINQGPSRANVLEQNLAGDTALHIAAQYGHTKVVQTLLECHSDAHIRNKKDETPLDLAAMYGRLTTVQVLIWSDRSLVKDSCETHSPLHLSARNGHTSVIEALLDFGMFVNQMCNRGTALHEAALFGKIDAVKILLNKGIDVNAKNDDDNTVLDLLVDLPSERSQEITALIYEQTQAMMSSGQGRSKSMSINSSEGSISGRPSRSGELKDEAKAHYTLVGGTTRSASVSQRPTNQDYSLVQYPRHSRHEGGYPQAAISPLIEDSSSRDDLFNDRFLRQMQPPSPGFAEDTEQRQGQSQLSTLSSKQGRTTTNLYEEHSVPAPNRTDAATYDDVPAPNRSPAATYDTVPLPNRSNAGTYDNVPAPSRNSAATYDMVPLPNRSSAATYDTVPAPKNRSSAAAYDSVPAHHRSSDATYDNVPAPKPSRESIPSFPPPPSDEALMTLKTYVGLDRLKANDQKENSGPGNELYENYRIDPKEPMSDFEKLHLRMSPPPPPANDTYDNVNITNDPATDMKPQTDLMSFSNAESEEIQPLPSARFSGVKQQRTRSSVKSASESSGGSRPPSTLNESYEWSKIDKIFSSFEDLIGGADGLGDVLHEAPVSIGEWLNNLDLSHYEASFVANGYDDIRYIGGDMLDEDDLREIGIQNPEHIRVILISASELPSPPQIGDHGFPIPESVTEWLTKINLLDYERRFAMNRYDSMDRIRAIWEFELTTVIGIHLSGHRKRMIYSLGHRPEQEREKVSWSKKFKDAEAPRATQSSSDDDAMDLANQLLKTAEEMVQGFENRKDKKEDSLKKTKPESPPKSPTSPKIVKYQPSFEWIHKPETLLYASVIYPTQYLGSHPVMVVRGTQSTVDACKKMKATSKMLQKVPTISLSISVRGIEFIDAQSNSTISNYDIRYISYCAQDPEDLSIFAYITKDAKTGKHYCHVFKAASLSLADEIVLTIGQGFELAYHQHRVLVDDAKERKKDDGSTGARQAKNQLHEQEKADTKGSGPPPLPKPYAANRQGKGSS